jgi:Homeobox KN domain
MELIAAQALVSLLESNIPRSRNIIGPRWRISDVQQFTLCAWFQSHKKFPYPSITEKEMLSQETGMSIKQISTWFVNRRRRVNVHKKHKRRPK